MNPPDPRIAIIGAGPAGLASAWFLQQQGYRNLTLFEKADRVGGKCDTFEFEGRAFDMAAHEMLAGYGAVMEIAKALKVPSAGRQSVLVYDRRRKAYADMLTATRAAGYGRLEILAAAARYTVLLLTRYRDFSQPGSGMAQAPADLHQPLSSWLAEHRLEALTETLLFVMKVQGFGRLDEIPAAYFVKFQGLRNWLSNVLHVAGVLPSWPRVFPDGFGSLWDAVAQRVEVRLNSRITAIERRLDPDGDQIEVRLQCKGEWQSFDRLILACPLDRPTLEGIGLDLDADESGLLGKVRTIPFVTTAATVDGIPDGVVGTIPLPSIEGYTGYIRMQAGSPLTVFFSLAESSDVPGERIVERIRQMVASLPQWQGQTPVLREVVRQRTWAYFPHVGVTDFAAGFHDQFAALQGRRHTYYISSLLGFETVGNTVAYAKDQILRQFPRRQGAV